jgi:uncharacterized protein
VSGPRRLVYLLASVGLVLTCLPQIVETSSRFLGVFFLLKSVGMGLNAPGLALVAAAGGYSITRTLFGKLVCWLLTLIVVEPVLRWIERPSRTKGVGAEAERTGLVSRRSFLVAGTGVAGAGLLSGYGCLYELRNLQLEQFVLTLPDLPPGLEGTRLVLMSDWHCGPVNRPRDLRPAIRLANQCSPDLVLLPGDFTSMSGRYFAEAAELASQLHPRIPGGVLVSWGNHDYWHGLEPGLQMMPEAGCHILTNRSLVLTARRELEEHGKGLWLCGIDDLWAGTPQLAESLARVAPDQPRLVLSHNPDVAEQQHGPRVDLMVSGHTHGGQVRIPTMGTPIIPSQYGQKYASGLVDGPGYKVYVSRGVGSSGLPVRFGVPPEVTVFELRRGPLVGLQKARLV